MKRILYFGLIILALTGCKKNETESGYPLQLVVSEDTVTFIGNVATSLFVSTKPATKCDFEITSYPDWVNVYPTAGTINKDVVEIHLSPIMPTASPGVYDGKLKIVTHLGTRNVYLHGIIGENLLYTIPDSLNFSVFAQSQDLVIINEGNVAISYSAAASNGFVSLPVTSGMIPVGQQGHVVVNANRQGMVTGTYFSKIYLTLNSKTDSVAVSIDAFKELKTILTTDVIDAEYSKARDILVYVSSSPSQLNIYKTATGTTEIIPLSYVPVCVSVAPDGATAVVGHDAHVSYIDLINKAVIRAYSVSCNPDDIVLGTNQWAYVFPLTDQWENIRCINLALAFDNEALSTGYNIYAGTKAKLHPSGKYIYGADNGISPSDIEKYDIQNGVANYLYDSPYHGDYPMSGDLWFSENGDRIFTRGQTVLKTSELQSQDMLYNGTVPLGGTWTQMRWLDHSSVKNSLYAISSDDDWWSNPNKPIIFVYNANNLVYVTEYRLEKYLVPDNQGGGTFYEAEPYFVFSNSAGNNIFVLTKAVGSGLVHEWAIQKIAIP